MEDIAISVDGPTVDPTDAEEWKRTAAHWSITLERDRRKFETDYWTGSGLVTYEPTRIEPGTHRAGTRSLHPARRHSPGCCTRCNLMSGPATTHSRISAATSATTPILVRRTPPGRRAETRTSNCAISSAATSTSS